MIEGSFAAVLGVWFIIAAACSIMVGMNGIFMGSLRFCIFIGAKRVGFALFIINYTRKKGKKLEYNPGQSIFNKTCAPLVIPASRHSNLKDWLRLT